MFIFSEVGLSLEVLYNIFFTEILSQLSDEMKRLVHGGQNIHLCFYESYVFMSNTEPET